VRYPDGGGLTAAEKPSTSRAEPALFASLRHRPESERRSRMLTTHQLADVQLRRARPEQACTTWQRFLDDYSNMHSARISISFRRFRSRLQQHRNNEVVRRRR
jgi:TolA-binding protein